MTPAEQRAAERLCDGQTPLLALPGHMRALALGRAVIALRHHDAPLVPSAVPAALAAAALLPWRPVRGAPLDRPEQDAAMGMLRGAGAKLCPVEPPAVAALAPRLLLCVARLADALRMEDRPNPALLFGWAGQRGRPTAPPVVLWCVNATHGGGWCGVLMPVRTQG